MTFEGYAREQLFGSEWSDCLEAAFEDIPYMVASPPPDESIDDLYAPVSLGAEGVIHYRFKKAFDPFIGVDWAAMDAIVDTREEAGLRIVRLDKSIQGKTMRQYVILPDHDTLVINEQAADELVTESEAEVVNALKLLAGQMHA